MSTSRTMALFSCPSMIIAELSPISTFVDYITIGTRNGTGTLSLDNGKENQLGVNQLAKTLPLSYKIPNTN
jgi:hypothetical protein